MNCPKCYAEKKQTRVVCTNHRMYVTRRYHKCLNCNHHWRSSEVLDNDGVHWGAPPKRNHGGFNTGEKHPNAILFDSNTYIYTVKVLKKGNFQTFFQSSVDLL